MPRGAGFTKAEKLNLLSLGEGREVRPAQLKRWRTQLAAGELGGAKRKNKYTPRRGPHAAGIIAFREEIWAGALKISRATLLGEYRRFCAERG